MSIIIVNYKSESLVESLLDSIELAITRIEAPINVIVVDNSDVPEHRLRKRLATNTQFMGHYLRPERNLGYGRGNNFGVNLAVELGSEYVWIVNPDVRMRVDALSELLEFTARSDKGHPAIWATMEDCGNDCILPGTATLNLLTSKTHRSHSTPIRFTGGQVVYPLGSSIVMTVRAFMILNGFGDSYFLFYEEADLTVRALRAGIPIETMPNVVIRHFGGGTTGTNKSASDRPVSTHFHASRSCTRFYLLNFPLYLPVALSWRLLRALLFMLRGQRSIAGTIAKGTFSGFSSKL